MSEAYEITIRSRRVFCPACGDAMAHPAHIDVGTVPIDQAAEVAQGILDEALEREIVRHYRSRHRLRYWLWCKTGWKRVIGRGVGRLA